MPKSILRYLILLMLLTNILVVSSPGMAAGADQQLYRIPMVSSPVKIDAVLDEQVWQDALVVEIKNEIQP
ncbi:MAG: hypothetical protein HOC71_17165, partial [Candidatus Latescibacteria bacterium]|nr:hypothetical protein [Candidatus Latescibacterota bacterium]